MKFVVILKRNSSWTWTPVFCSVYKDAVRKAITNYRGQEWEVVLEAQASKRIRQLNGLE